MRRSSFGIRQCRRGAILAGLVLCWMLILTHDVLAAAASASLRCVLIEVYFKPGDAQREALLQAADELKAARAGITVVLRDVEADPRNRQRLEAICKHYRLPPDTSPVAYGCNRVLHASSSAGMWKA